MHVEKIRKKKRANFFGEFFQRSQFLRRRLQFDHREKTKYYNKFFFIFFCTVKIFFFKNVLFKLVTVLGFRSKDLSILFISIPSKYEKCHKKPNILKMKILLAHKSPLLGYLTQIFTVRHSFFKVLLLFHIPYIYIGYFFVLYSHG